jgi:RNA polymerase sigma-70 factor (ECF subfamily)
MDSVGSVRKLRHEAPEATDAELVAGARAGQRWAQEALFRRHAGAVRGLAFRLAGARFDVDDLVQDVFHEALRGLDRLQNPEVVRSWLGGIVVRQVQRRLRRSAVRARLGLTRVDQERFERALSANAPPDVVLELRLVYRLVERLPNKIRLAFLLRRVEGMPLDAVAEHLGVSRSSAKRWIASADESMKNWAESTRTRSSRGGS